VRELDEPPEPMADPAAVDDGPRTTLAERVDDGVRVREVVLEGGPRLAGRRGEMRVRRAEPGEAEVVGDPLGTSVLMGESLVSYVSIASIRAAWAVISGRVSETVANSGCGTSTAASCRSNSAIAPSNVM